MVRDKERIQSYLERQRRLPPEPPTPTWHGFQPSYLTEQHEQSRRLPQPSSEDDKDDCVPNKICDLLYQSEPDSKDMEFKLCQSPIQPPANQNHDEPNTTGREKKVSPKRRVAERQSLTKQEAPQQKRPRLRLRVSNPAVLLHRARKDAIARRMRGIYCPEEYDPDHIPVTEPLKKKNNNNNDKDSSSRSRSPSGPRIKLVFEPMTFDDASEKSDAEREKSSPELWNRGWKLKLGSPPPKKSQD